MDLLLASTEDEWEGWIAKVLQPAAEAFGFRVIRLTGPAGSEAFEAKPLIVPDQLRLASHRVCSRDIAFSESITN